MFTHFVTNYKHKWPLCKHIHQKQTPYSYRSLSRLAAAQPHNKSLGVKYAGRLHGTNRQTGTVNFTMYEKDG